MRKFLFYLIVALPICLASKGQTVSQKTSNLIEVPPESAGFSPERLERIDHSLQQFVTDKWMNGAVTLIMRNGKIVYYRSFGYDDVEKRIPLRKDAIFRIASQTKAITAVAVMMLYEEGKFLLDDPISRYIPEFKKPRVLNKFNPADTTYTVIPANREITIRDLLTHTSGIGYAQIGSKEANAIYFKNGITAGLGFDGYESRLLATDMKKLGRLPLMHQPGEKWTYGLNSDLLGYLVEQISGMPLDYFFRTRIFEPLGMNDTWFYLPPEKQARLANMYEFDSTGALQKAPPVLDFNGKNFRDYPKGKGTYFSGGGGLSSTVKDYAIFLQMLLNGGTYNGKRLLAQNTVRMMTMNQIGSLSLGPNKFGLGFMITTKEGSAILPTPESVFEWGGAFATTYWADPKEKMVALIYRQLWGDEHHDIADKFKVLVYQALNE